MRKPMIMAHAVNTGALAQKIRGMRPDITEIDVRKSKDGVLFCHHGSFPFGLASARFLRFLPFHTIKKLIVVETLQEVIATIADDAIVFLDLKDRNITARDLQIILRQCSSRKIWIAAYSLSQIAALKKELGRDCIFVYNFGFLRFARAITHAHTSGAEIVQLFFWQCTPQRIAALSHHGLDYAVCSFLLPRKIYEYVAMKHNLLWIYYDFHSGT